MRLKRRVKVAQQLIDAYAMCNPGDCPDCDLIRRIGYILDGTYTGDLFDWDKIYFQHGIWWRRRYRPTLWDRLDLAYWRIRLWLGLPYHHHNLEQHRPPPGGEE